MFRSGWVLGLTLLVAQVNPAVGGGIPPAAVSQRLTSFSALNAYNTLEAIRAGLKDHQNGKP
ncbi:MAG: hypothetical protein WC943_17855, partial [Elusimicrobiota bacterium]